MNKGFGLAVALLLILGSIGSWAGAAAPEAGDAQSYLVGFKDQEAMKEFKAQGVQVIDAWKEIGAAQVKASATGLRSLRQNPHIAYVEEDAERFARASYTDGALTWGLQAVKAQEAWNAGATGAGIRVCVLDTGIDLSHPEFRRADGTLVVKGYANFSTSKTINDIVGHGTHVAATIAGQTDGSGSLIGVAPGVDLYIAKVLGDNGSGRSSWVIKGLQWCTNTVKANIVSLSLGSSKASVTEEKQFKKSYDAGVLALAAAGNEGTTAIEYPAGYASVISVAAIDHTLTVASFSQYNADVELAAPGVSVLSAVPTGTGSTVSAMEDGTTYGANPVEYAAQGRASGPLVECGLADSASSCGTTPTGTWIALINRGTITFADKVQNVMAQGAAAAIIANNDSASPDDPGSFTLGNPGTWIPAVSVSYNSGAGIRGSGLGMGSVWVDPWDYAFYDGTSMATPHASAVAALAWSARPGLTNQQIRQILQQTALDLGDTGRDYNYGFGLPQADAAVAAAKTAK